MTAPNDLGGEPPCWAHMVEPPDRDLRDCADIEQLVRAFYRRAATDELLGPVFEAAHVDWSSHIPKLIDFARSGSSRFIPGRSTAPVVGFPPGSEGPRVERTEVGYPFGTIFTCSVSSISRG